LIDQGHIVRSGDRWRAAEGVVYVDIPDTVQGVLAARIDLLAPAEKRTLQLASVVGRVFWPGPVIELLGGDDSELYDVLGRLEARELLVLPRLDVAAKGSAWISLLDLSLAELPALDLSLLPPEIGFDRAGAENAQTREIFAKR
jgi:hypothetical protein